MKINSKVRFMSLVLALVTVFTLVPMSSALAASENEVTFDATTVEENSVASILEEKVDRNMVSDEPAAAQATASGSYEGGYGITVSSMTVYSNQACTNAIGTLYDNEGFTILHKYSNNVLYVRYSTSSGAKEGYIQWSTNYYVFNYSECTCIGKPWVTTAVYYGPNSSLYMQVGTVYTSDIVAVLSVSGNWTYIEYDTTSGRKRGYVAWGNLQYFDDGVNYWSDFYFNDSGYTQYVSGYHTVYAGPSYRYFNVGSVSNENVIIKGVFQRNTEGAPAYFVEYNVTGTSQKKTGFIFL